MPEEEAGFIPDDNLLLICTGSQGEPRSALAKIGADTHPAIALGEGDTVIFSSRMIPGNERGILQLQDELVAARLRGDDRDDHMVHVSGHPARDELKRLYQLVKPKYAVPVHGEWRHLSEHAALAKEPAGHPGAGRGWRCAPARPGRPGGGGGRADRAAGGRQRPAAAAPGGVLAARKRMLFNGVVMASFAVDEAGRVLGTPQVSAPGLFDGDDHESAATRRRPGAGGGDLPAPMRREDDALREAARACCARRSAGGCASGRCRGHLLRV